MSRVRIPSPAPTPFDALAAGASAPRFGRDGVAPLEARGRVDADQQQDGSAAPAPRDASLDGDGFGLGALPAGPERPEMSGHVRQLPAQADERLDGAARTAERRVEPPVRAG